MRLLSVHCACQSDPGRPYADAPPSSPLILYAGPDRATERQLAEAGRTIEARLVPRVSDHFDSIDAAILRSIDAQIAMFSPGEVPVAPGGQHPDRAGPAPGH